MDDEIHADDIQQCAERAVASWDLRPTALRFVAARENAVFRLECADGRSFALRVHRPGYHSLAELESEIEWTRALLEAGISVPQPLLTRAGTAYATVPYGAAGDTRQVGLVEWIDGTPLDDVLRHADPVPIYRELGGLMARMHNQAAAWTPSPGFVRHSLDANGLIGDAPWWGPFWDLPEMSPEQSTVITAARHLMYRTLVEYGTDRSSYSIIHADLLPQNVLMYRGAPVVIDFDDAGHGWHQYDMTVALVAFVGTSNLEACREAMLVGYRHERDFSDEDAAMLPMFMTIRQLVELGWLHTRVAEFLPVSADRKISRSELMAPRIERAVEGCRQVLDA
ncbi:MAG: hypothetical protein RI958_1289 [Actinomycetota bacterium]